LLDEVRFLMKRLILIFTFMLASLTISFISREASAQYYGYYFAPNSFNCFSGCGTEAKVAAWASVGLSAIDAALGVHQYSKQLELQTNQNIYQIEQAKAQANYYQTLQDYQNILKVAPFFDDDPTIQKPQAYPKVSPITQKKSEMPIKQ